MAQIANKVHNDQRELAQGYDMQINLSWYCLTSVEKKKFLQASYCVATGINYRVGIIDRGMVIILLFLSQCDFKYKTNLHT